MRKTKVEHLTQEFTPGIKTLVGIKITQHQEKPFIIPVIDVRTSDNHRKAVEGIIKQANIQRGSKYMKQSYSWYGYSYNHSMKNK